MPVETLRYEADITALKAALDDIKASQERVEKSTEESTKRISGHWDAARVAVGTAVGNIAARMGTELATRGVQFIGQSITAASDMGETVSKVGQLFGGEASAGLLDWASTADSALGQSKQQALDAAATFAVFGKSAGMTGTDLAGFSTETTKLASDLASFHNTSPQEAIEAIGAAMRGEAEPIRKYGILLNDAALKAVAVGEGWIAAGDDMDAGTKVMAAQRAIMLQAGDAVGDFSRTSGGLANQQRILGAQLENSKAKLGEALLPAMLIVTQAASQFLVPAISKVGEVLSSVSAYLTEHQGVAKAAAIVAGVILVGAFLAWAVSAASAAVATIAATWPIIAIIAAIAALVAGLIWAYQNVGWFREAIQAVASFITGTLWPVLQGIGQVIWTVASVYIAAVITYFRFWWEAIQTLWGVAWPIISGISDLVRNVVGWIGDHIGALARTMGGVADMITSPFRSAFNAVARAWNSTVGSLSFTVPSWVPGLGGKGFDVPDIPTFDTGAFVTQPTFALLSANRIPEIVSPLPQLRAVVAEAVAAAGPRTGTQSVTYVLNGATALTPADLVRAQEVAAFRLRVGAA